MRICLAQIKPKKGNISANIDLHKRFIDIALTYNVDAIFFPELSLTSYEPKLAHELASNHTDKRLDIFQQISNNTKIIIGLGLPTLVDSKIRISMIIFEPNKQIQTYSKQQLHSDELPYFENGVGQVLINVNNTSIAPAICYESLQEEHAEIAFKLGANIYLASVAKSEKGCVKAFDYFPKLAKQYSIPVLMSNCVGCCDDFLTVGKSAVWTKDGNLADQLDSENEGILIFDTENEEVIMQKI